MEELVSVVIPTYNRTEKLLKEYLINRCLESVYNQTYKNIEIIVVIDGTSKLAENLLKKEMKDHPNLSYYTYGERVGAATTRNFGIDKAKGKWIALLDDDDEWVPEKIEKQYEFIRGNVNIITFCSMKFKNKIIPRIAYRNQMTIDQYIMCRRMGRHIGTVQTSTIFCAKEVYKKVMFTDKLKKHQDWDWIIQAQEEFPIIHLELPLSVYHIDETPSMSNKNMWNYSLNWIENIKDRIQKNSYDSFILEYVAYSIIFDDSLSRYKKVLVIKNIFCKVSLINLIKPSFIFLSFRIFIGLLLVNFKRK